MKLLEQIHGDGTRVLLFECPGCQFLHAIAVQGGGVDPRPRWTWNGDKEKPTFTPSILVSWDRNGKPNVCHSFVTDGHIQFLNDCTHGLVGQTVDLPEIEP